VTVAAPGFAGEEPVVTGAALEDGDEAGANE
jgi:hypothetical protein